MRNRALLLTMGVLGFDGIVICQGCAERRSRNE